MKKEGVLALILAIVLISATVYFTTAPNSKQQMTENNSSIAAETSVIEILPVNSSQISYQYGGIWPFGAKGGDHPNGHPGIDFELTNGADVFAVTSGKMGDVADSGHYSFTTTNLFTNKGYQIIYTGGINFTVKKDTPVKAGDIIGHISSNDSWKGFHFELRSKTGTVLCPYDYFSNEAKKEMDAMFYSGNVFYDMQDEFPSICNPCPEGGCR